MLENEIAEFQIRNKFLQDENTRLSGTAQRQRRQIHNLQARNCFLQHDNTRLSHSLGTAQKRMIENVKTFKNSIGELQTQNCSLQQDNTRLSQDLDVARSISRSRQSTTQQLTTTQEKGVQACRENASKQPCTQGTKLACMKCRAVKTRYSGIPCNRCKLLDIQCERPVPKPKGRRPKRPRSSHAKTQILLVNASRTGE
jgi:hypothetical protein